MRGLSVDPTRPALRRLLLLAVLAVLAGCGDETAPSSTGSPGDAGDAGRTEAIRDAGTPGSEGDGGSDDPPSLDAGPREGGVRQDAGSPEPSALPYAESVVAFVPGPGAGFGQDRFPDVVLGPPAGSGAGSGSLDVLSLGVGGEIVLAFGERDLVDRAGPDLVVFENPFWVGNDPTRVFAELGEVSVSTDGASWRSFPCDVTGAGMGQFPGCAGWTPTRVYDPAELPLDPMNSGGDAFDLAEVGLERARYVRIRDLATTGQGPSAGFDLDAVGGVHLEPSGL